MEVKTYASIEINTAIPIKEPEAKKVYPKWDEIVLDLVGGVDHPISIYIDDREPTSSEELEKYNKAPLLRIKKGVKAVRVGCVNNNNCCYMNALLQALNNIQTLKDAILQYNHKGNNILNTLKEIMKGLDTEQMNAKSNCKWYIDPIDTNIYEIVEASPYVQSDPREILTNLLEKIGEVDKNIAESFEYTEEKIMYETNSSTSYRYNILNINEPNTRNSNRTYTMQDLINANLNVSDINEEGIMIGATSLEIEGNVLCINLNRTYDTITKEMYRGTKNQGSARKNRGPSIL